jgi:hypothetical protein
MTSPIPSDSRHEATPSSAPTSGSRFRKTPALAVLTRSEPQFHNRNVSMVQINPIATTDPQVAADR